MDEADRSRQPWFFGILGVLVLGLTSLSIWLLRLISQPAEKKTAVSSSADHLHDEEGARYPAVERFRASGPSSGEGMDARLTSREKTASPPETTYPPRPTPPNTPVDAYPWAATTRYIAGTGIFLFVLWLIGYSRQSLTLLVFAALIAILVRPAIHSLQERLRFSQGLAVGVVYLVVALLVFALPVLIIPSIAHAVNSLLNYDWPNLLQGIARTLGNAATRLATIPLVGSWLADSFTALANAVSSLFTARPTANLPAVPMTDYLSGLGRAIGILGGLIGPLASGILSLVFMIMISLQMSLASRQIKGWVVQPFPERYVGEIGSLLDRILGVWQSFLRSQLTLMLVMGLVTWMFNLLVGTPQALLLGILAGLTEIIPNLGLLLATIPAAILAALLGSSVFPGLNPWVFMLVVIVGYGLMDLVENQVLVPRILGGALSLPPLIVLIGVTIAGSTAGIVGIFLATPMMATGKELLGYVMRKIYQEPAMQPPPEEPQPSFMDPGRGLAARIRPLFRRAAEDKGQPARITGAEA